jgi:hypothetical protein
VQSVSASGDECHHDIFGWELKEAENTIKKLSLENLNICTQEGVRKLQIEDLS